MKNKGGRHQKPLLPTRVPSHTSLFAQDVAGKLYRIASKDKR